MKYILSSLLALTLFISCNPENAQPQPAKDYTAENEKEITDYISKNNLTAKRTDSGLYYVINEPGQGTQPTATSTVTVTYKGYFTNGNIFDQSTTGITYPLTQFIKGWTEGLQYFKAGGSGILLVPSHLGYGPYSNERIPGGSVLVFDIKLISVN